MQGVVFNGHYLTYCDVCVTEYWRAIGLRYPDELLAAGTDLFVRKAALEYRAPAVYDDELVICGRTARLGRSSLLFTVQMFRREATAEALLDAELVYVHAAPASKKALPWTAAFRERVRSYEWLTPEEPHGAQ